MPFKANEWDFQQMENEILMKINETQFVLKTLDIQDLQRWKSRCIEWIYKDWDVWEYSLFVFVSFNPYSNTTDFIINTLKLASITKCHSQDEE